MNDTESLIDDVDTVVRSIQSGEYDAEIGRIVSAANSRSKHLALMQGWSLRVGDRVQITSGRPRYIVGECATVCKVMQTYVSIRLDNSIGKFSNHSTIRCPMTMLKKIPAN